MPPLPPQQQGQQLDMAANAEEEDDDDLAEPSFFLQQLGQYFTLILAPLLFGGLTCLFVLPLVAEGRASLPPEGFWPITLVIIAIIIAQGAAVYYAGSNQSLWILATLCGFFLFLIVGCFAIFGLVPGLVLFVAIIAIGVALARQSFHPVPEGFVDIVFASGKYSRTLYHGFNLLLPWEKVAYQINVEETQWICPEQRVQLSRDEDVVLGAVVSYQVVPEDAHLAVTQVNNWEEAMRQLFITTLQNVATTFTPEDFLVWPQGLHAQAATRQQSDAFTGSPARREQLNNNLFQHMRDKVALWGIQVNWVRIQDIELVRHEISAASKQPASPPPTKAQEPKQQQSTQDQPPVTQATFAQSSPAGQSMGGKARKQEPPQQPPNTPGKILKEEVLIKAYKEVQNDKITDPETIRGIAASFEAIARDPQASQTVSFDAARAALNLYEQARKYEEQQYGGQTIYDETTKPDWIARPATDENLMAGG